MNPRNDERMTEIYEFIKGYIEENGTSPTTAEICSEFNISKATVSKFVGRLVEIGDIERAGRYGLSVGFARCKAMCPCFPEKSLCINPSAVPKPTQVGGYKNTKARERNLVKELGNIAP